MQPRAVQITVRRYSNVSWEQAHQLNCLRLISPLPRRNVLPKVLKTLFGYLPEEIRNSPDTGTVITVPAAFDQMQKNATMAAAEMAGIGKVELVQEPVAAVMSYMKARGGTDGIFLIYNLGGGTLVYRHRRKHQKAGKHPCTRWDPDVWRTGF